MNDIQITMTGNLVADPELRYTPKGVAVLNARIASTPRMQKGGQWVDAGPTVFLGLVAWRKLAENVAETLKKGQRVNVTGRLRQRSYEVEGGGTRTVYEVHADDIAPSLKAGTVAEPAPAAEPAEPAAPAEPATAAA